MLVSLKADTLERLEQEEEEETDLEGFSDLESLDSNGDRRLPLHLERHIRRRASAPPPKRRRVTLQELIEQIQQIAVQLEENSSKTRIPRSRPYTRKEALRTITQLAHDENLTELATQLEQFLGQNFSQLAQEQNYVDLEQLLEWWTKFNLTDTNHTEITNSSAKTHDRVGIFWALLLLSSQSKVELMQEEFYQDLIIKPLI
jgi:segregation and condensation protein A